MVVLATNLATFFAMQGWRVGVVDADINGPSLATMFGVRGHQLRLETNGVLPAIGPLGVQLMSMDLFLAEDKTPVVWNGPNAETFLWRGTMERFVANAIYDLPFGNGKQYWNGSNGVVNRLVGGWSLGGIVVWQTRQPFYIVSNRTTVNQFNAINNPAQLVGISFEDFKKNVGVFKTPTGVYFINPNLLNITTNSVKPAS